MIVIEHNLDVIKSSDWIIDMGPEGGHRGGLVIAEGTPEQIAAEPASHTGAFLQHMLVEVPAQPKKRSVAAPKKAPAKRAAAKV